LSEESNPVDDCAKYIISLLSVNDVASVQGVIEALSGVHYDKVKHGHIRSDFLVKHVFKKKELEKPI